MSLLGELGGPQDTSRNLLALIFVGVQSDTNHEFTVSNLVVLLMMFDDLERARLIEVE